MDTKTILTRGIEVVTFFFAAFSSFLIDIAPPGETDSRFAIGISSIFMLFILLFISATTKKQRREKMKKIWLLVSIVFFISSIVSSFVYKSNLDSLTFPYPPEQKKAEYIAGADMTPEAQRYHEDNPLKTPSEILAAFEGPASIERVWPKESLNRAKMILTVNYVIVVLSFATMLFCLTEGILSTPGGK
jgi:hypothetical protein